MNKVKYIHCIVVFVVFVVPLVSWFLKFYNFLCLGDLNY